MRLIYNISIYIYLFAIRTASFFNVKAKLWIEGRENIFFNIKSAVHNSEIIWFHCASLGEFEQGRPLIEKYKAQHPTSKILLTFFSPSGYEIRKNYSGADYIFYLPIDTLSNAKKFIESVKPKAVFFVKYEFWFNYLNQLKIHNIPTYLVSGIFREDQHFFKKYGTWFRKQLSCFTHFYLQDEASSELLKKIGYKNVTVAGDTRFDRVFEISKNVRSIPLIEKFKNGNSIFIAGSTWEEDEKIILNLFNKQTNLKPEKFKLIIAPHEIDEKHVGSIEAQFAALSGGAVMCLRYSNADESNIKVAEVLIIDNIGMLSSIYQYGTLAYIGGGFGKGIHNILEAATFGLPIIFGPNYHKFTEAKELIHLGGAFVINDAVTFEKTVRLLSDKTVLQAASHIAKYYVNSRVGASDKILSSITIK